MSAEVTIICDRCSRVIVAAKTAKLARCELVEELGGKTRPPLDWCAGCLPAAMTQQQH